MAEIAIDYYCILLLVLLQLIVLRGVQCYRVLNSSLVKMLAKPCHFCGFIEEATGSSSLPKT